jgi:hypothetical protein
VPIGADPSTREPDPRVRFGGGEPYETVLIVHLTVQSRPFMLTESLCAPSSRSGLRGLGVTKCDADKLRPHVLVWPEDIDQEHRGRSE